MILSLTFQRNDDLVPFDMQYVGVLDKKKKPEFNKDRLRFRFNFIINVNSLTITLFTI